MADDSHSKDVNYKKGCRSIDGMIPNMIEMKIANLSMEAKNDSERDAEDKVMQYLHVEVDSFGAHSACH